MREIFAKLAIASLSWIFLATDQYLPYSCNKIKPGVDKAWLPKLVTTNQFISGKSWNKLITNNSWFTVRIFPSRSSQKYFLSKLGSNWIHNEMKHTNISLTIKGVPNKNIYLKKLMTKKSLIHFDYFLLQEIEDWINKNNNSIRYKTVYLVHCLSVWFTCCAGN